MKKYLPSFPFKSILAALAIIFCGSSYVKAQQVQITLTGYSDDVIADATLNTDASDVTTNSIDPTGAGYVFFAQGYSSDETAFSNGLPDNGQFTSTLGHNFQLAPFNQNNDLSLQTAQSGTLTFGEANQISYDSLFILATGGNGSVDVNYTINFSDESTETGSFTIDDWLCASCDSYAISGLGRVRRVNSSLDETNQFAIREYLIPLLAGDHSKTVVSVGFSVTSDGIAVANIFGITGYMAGSLPVTLEYFNVTSLNGKAVLQWKTSQEFNSSKFIVERASSANPTSFAEVGEVNATGSATGSTYTFTNDAGVSGTYLYRLLQTDIDGNIKILGTKSISFNTRIKWLIQDLGTQWQLISSGAFIYRLIDMNGRILQAATGIGSATISKPEAHGIYEIQVQTGGQFSTQRLIK